MLEKASQALWQQWPITAGRTHPRCTDSHGAGSQVGIKPQAELPLPSAQLTQPTA